MDILEMINLGKKFSINKSEDGSYEIEHNQYYVGASIDSTGVIIFYVTNAYNSGTQWLEIDVTGLEELKKFCEIVISKEKNK